MLSLWVKKIKILYDKIMFFLQLLKIIWYLVLNRTQLNIFIDGGLGDVIALTPYYRVICRYCNVRFILHTKNTRGTKENFNHGTTRFFNSPEGLIDPRVEWMKVFFPENILMTKKQSNIQTVKMHHRNFINFFPVINIANNRSQTEHYFISQRKKTKNKYSVNEKWDLLNAHRQLGRKIVAVHLRRNAELILRFCEKLESKSDLCFLLLGSSEHQIIPDFSNLTFYVSLLESYKQGLDTLDVLDLSMSADLFVGGRGGFEVFHLTNMVPSVIFFDNMHELDTGSFDKRWWAKNQISEYSHNTTKFDHLFRSACEVLNDH